MTSSRRREPLRRPARDATAIALSGALLGAIVYALVAGAPRLYETFAVVSAAAPALIGEYDAVSDAAAPGRGADGAGDGLDRADLGDVATLVERVRERLGPPAAGAEVDLRIDDTTGEVRIVVRSHRPRIARQVADEVAAGIVRLRDTATSEQHTAVRAELRLVAALAVREPRLRPRLAALRTRAVYLDQLDSMPGGGLSVMREARTPTRPVAPRVARDVVLAVVAGMLGCATLMSLGRARPWRLPRVRGSHV